MRIHLVGQVRIFNGESEELAKVTHHVLALLAYLLLHRHRSHSREVLAGKIDRAVSELLGEKDLEERLQEIREKIRRRDTR